MASAGAATKAFLALTHTPLGFDPDNVFVINTCSQGCQHELAGSAEFE